MNSSIDYIQGLEGHVKEIVVMVYTQGLRYAHSKQKFGTIFRIAHSLQIFRWELYIRPYGVLFKLAY